MDTASSFISRTIELIWTIKSPNSTTTSLSSIVLSSLFTLLISTWCCIRPDVPSPHDSKIRILSTRLNLFFWMLICPEAVLLWSMRQWVEAGKVAKTYRDRGWTRRQALFLLMGGFVLCKDGLPLQTLSAQHLTRLLNHGAIDFPSVTIADIQERSNFHPIFALLVFLQISWFIIQSLTRLINGVIITPLEFITLTIVCVNAITLIFTWKKPLDTRYPILVYPKSNIGALNEPENSFANVGDAFRREQKSSRTLEQIFQLEEPQQYLQYPISLSRLLRRCLKFMLSWPFRSVYRDAVLLAMTTNASEQPPGTLGHPLFYISDSIDLRRFLFPITTLAAGTNIATYVVLRFRGSFPSENAWSVWQFNSLASTVFMTVLFFLMATVNLIRLLSRNRFDWADGFAEVLVFIAMLFFLLTLLPFVIFRILLLLVSLFCLKGLPEESLTIIPWTNYIPHFS